MRTRTSRSLAAATLSLLLVSWLPAWTWCPHGADAAAAQEQGAQTAHEHGAVPAHDHGDADAPAPDAPDCPDAFSAYGCGVTLVLPPAPSVRLTVASDAAAAEWPRLTLHEITDPTSIFRPPIG